MEGIDPSVWAEVERAAQVRCESPEEFVQAALKGAASVALATVEIYVLGDPRTGAIRYVGQTVDLTNRMKAHRRDKDGSARAAWVAELRSEGLAPDVQVVAEVLAAEADYSEQWFIEGFRADGHDLLNKREVYDLPSLEVRLIPPTFEWICAHAARVGCSPAHVFEKAIVVYMQALEEEAAGAPC